LLRARKKIDITLFYKLFLEGADCRNLASVRENGRFPALKTDPFKG